MIKCTLNSYKCYYRCYKACCQALHNIQGGLKERKREREKVPLFALPFHPPTLSLKHCVESQAVTYLSTILYIGHSKSSCKSQLKK